MKTQPLTACKQYCPAAGATQGNIAYTQNVMPHAKKATKMTESIKEKILDIHAIVSNRLNSNEKSFSSEKSIVFDFAWQFSVKYQSLIENIDFETSLFNSF